MRKHIKFETNEPQFKTAHPDFGMQHFLLKHKIAKNTSQANILLLCITLILLLVSLGIMLSFQIEPQAPLEPDPDTLI